MDHQQQILAYHLEIIANEINSDIKISDSINGILVNEQFSKQPRFVRECIMLDNLVKEILDMVIIFMDQESCIKIIGIKDFISKYVNIFEEIGRICRYIDNEDSQKKILKFKKYKEFIKKRVIYAKTMDSSCTIFEMLVSMHQKKNIK